MTAVTVQSDAKSRSEQEKDSAQFDSIQLHCCCIQLKLSLTNRPRECGKQNCQQQQQSLPQSKHLLFVTRFGVQQQQQLAKI